MATNRQIGDVHMNSFAPSWRGTQETGSAEGGTARLRERQSGDGHNVTQAASGELALSSEELRIIDLIVRGFANTRVARDLSLSKPTVCRRIARLLRKLQVANRIELVLFATDRGILNGASDHPADLTIVSEPAMIRKAASESSGGADQLATGRLFRRTPQRRASDCGSS
jgi:DNA-binding CsgD family transcriptional regulator